ncbi:hypothetical protein CDD81_4588 [Ophiocordyceps australis]|uniref:BTB domain-containing protein n=1 Tax=Ophiocordyceps australis TaxID=1399860 RepID=A0A2C5XTK8_9HYPO|nr:hypothetical protein CDD81_4588 [Ophiocordyceps australis]
MERLSKKAVAASKPFKFIVGPSQAEFTIHSSLVAHQSPALEALVNGDFKESSDFCVKWDDIDDIVFSSFWQFAYTGDYDTPELIPPATAASNTQDSEANLPNVQLAEGFATWVDSEHTPAAEEFSIEIGGDDWPPEPRSFGKGEKNGRDDFNSIICEHDSKKAFWEDFQDAWKYPSEPSEVDMTLKDSASPLVHHAKVYTFADRYAIMSLMKFSCNKLHQTLVHLELHEENCKDVVELVRFVSEEPVPDQLRDLVAHYATCVVEHLWKLEEFQHLVSNDSFFCKALIGSMLLRFK